MKTYTVTFYDLGEIKNIRANNESSAMLKAIDKMNKKIIPAIYPGLPVEFMTVCEEDVAAIEVEYKRG